MQNETLGPEYDEAYDEDYLAGSKELLKPIRIANQDSSSSSSDSLTSEASLETEQDEIKVMLELHKKDRLNLGRQKMRQLQQQDMQLLEK